MFDNRWHIVSDSPYLLTGNLKTRPNKVIAHLRKDSHVRSCQLIKCKEANIIPLFNHSSRNKSDNNRPVSLTSAICKLLKRIIKDHVVDFLVRHKLVNSYQHEFLKARSYLNMLFF